MLGESSPEQINTQHLCNAAGTNSAALPARRMCEGLERANRGWRPNREDDNLKPLPLPAPSTVAALGSDMGVSDDPRVK